MLKKTLLLTTSPQTQRTIDISLSQIVTTISTADSLCISGAPFYETALDRQLRRVQMETKNITNMKHRIQKKTQPFNERIFKNY